MSKPASDESRAKKTQTVRKGGRPSAGRSEQLRDHILQVASVRFLAQGYGATSIESIALVAGISKRTFYHRFADKTELFAAVVHRLVTKLRPENDEKLFIGKSREAILESLAKIILQTALRPEALALHRILVSESMRFPELAKIMDSISARAEAARRIADMLQQTAVKKLSRRQAEFSAEQFLEIVVAIPQRRALGLGEPMSLQQLAQWPKQAVSLFLHGCDGLAKDAATK